MFLVLWMKNIPLWVMALSSSLEPDQTQTKEYLSFIDANLNWQQPSHVSLTFAAQSSVSTLDHNITPWETDPQTWQQQPPAVSQQQEKRRKHTNSFTRSTTSWP
jgi:predicted phosphoadenosine phosphosulfate sulfurtransferase